uniref:Uncharacterized protein n=1 Tax=Lotharella oceanica TaxID=641309 RepID=A0A7S2XGL1_9EUKA|mmetsp:Transcript_7320/g.14326  ORF Transcript_7320/g.14326 Transcript_7320/m.14326 type:complete len:364 (+) Transcript_7320:134-1225(+)|eukprot:CAMPEP_0170172132 /NCGR_PEP_ID=MMETSP0040_2-20121228/5370_1 /TAXON_ID=641309 /ORGANISM="Lotharella oceanica, Strain CCMP622" /LENGTH=363 /DNA_ID=CAMNT_0010412639 /DNA_START=100 /DNA_END=1191 /DNA_ORIENTATION=-
MGICAFCSDEKSETSRVTDSEMEKSTRNIFRLLVLGVSNSGKSTLCQHLTYLHGHGFGRAELQMYKHIIRSNVVEYMQQILMQRRNPDNKSFNVKPKLIEAAEYVMSSEVESNGYFGFTEEMYKELMKLWDDREIRETKVESMDDNATFFLNKLNILSLSGYCPSPEDVLHSRVRSAGFGRSTFSVKDGHFEMTDVGEETSDLRKWSLGYEMATSVLFIISLTSYSEISREARGKEEEQKTEENTNPRTDMERSIRLFKDICEESKLQHASIILFLNKLEIFKKRIKQIPLKNCRAFASFEGPEGDFKSAVEYIKKTIPSHVQVKRRIYVYLTCAIDEKNVRRIFENVSDTLQSEAQKQVPRA